MKIKIPELTHATRKRAASSTPNSIPIPECKSSIVDIRLREAEGKKQVPLVDFSMLDDQPVSRNFKIISIPNAGRPEMVIQVDDSWPYIELAPLYDVHIGSQDQDEEKFLRHLRWIKDSPYVLTWNGGDMVDNATVNSVADPGDSLLNPNEQYSRAKELLLEIRHKILFAITGNHESRTKRLASLDVAKLFANELKIPYSRDYMFFTLLWRGLKFRGLAHHGSGGAQTPGGILNAARKDMPWAHGLDFYWSGHLHQPKADVVSCTDFNQNTNEIIERDAAVIISPSYVKYFGSYAALKRMAPGVRGLTVARLTDDGCIEITLHANGKRL